MAKKSTKKAKTPRSIQGTAWKKLSWIINITLFWGVMPTLHCLERDTPSVTKRGAGKRGWLFLKLLFVQLSFGARNQN